MSPSGHSPSRSPDATPRTVSCLLYFVRNVKLFIGVTDQRLITFWSREKPSEVNYWLPGSRHGFRALEVGEPFLFKPHFPGNSIVGGGFFKAFTRFPLSFAWRSFQTANGVGSHREFLQAINRYRDRVSRGDPDPNVGCVILSHPFFLAKKDWIPLPADWSASIVRGKLYRAEDPEGKKLREELVNTLKRKRSLSVPSWIRPEPPRFAKKRRSKAGGQTSRGECLFRVRVTDAYRRHCAVTDERFLPGLTAAHIRPLQRGGSNRTSNGILLRSDLADLFCRGHLTVDPDFHVHLGGKIQSSSGYRVLEGKKLRVLPERIFDRPASSNLEWHGKHLFSS